VGAFDVGVGEKVTELVAEAVVRPSGGQIDAGDAGVLRDDIGVGVERFCTLDDRAALGGQRFQVRVLERVALDFAVSASHEVEVEAGVAHGVGVDVDGFGRVGGCFAGVAGLVSVALGESGRDRLVVV